METYEIETYNETYGRFQKTVVSSTSLEGAKNAVLTNDNKQGITSTIERVCIMYDNGSFRQVFKRQNK